MNINFLKFNEHTQTEEFLDMLYANNILPIITKPTRLTDHTATLTDHIYTNCLQNFTAGILTVDITDHVPIFCLVRTQPTLACEQALLFGRVKRVSRERASERRSREGQRNNILHGIIVTKNILM